MKSILIFFFVSYSLTAFSQGKNKIDSIFYFLDTTRVAPHDKMWNVITDDVFKTYILQCPCLKNGGFPTFFYSVTDPADKGVEIDKKQLKKTTLISLSALINISKQLLDTQMISREVFFIEPGEKKYKMHRMALINPAIKIVAVPDVIASKPDNSAFETKGLINVNSKTLADYYNKSVITAGTIVGHKKIKQGNISVLLLFVGASYPNQDFSIIIKGDHINNFDPLLLYKSRNRPIRVVGKVLLFDGKPSIEITKENQIQQWKKIN